MFSKLSEAKVNSGVFTGPQIWQMLDSKKLKDKMSALEIWQSFCNVVHGFLRSNKAEYKDSVENFVRLNLTDVNKEHGVHFHQDIYVIDGKRP